MLIRVVKGVGNLHRIEKVDKDYNNYIIDSLQFQMKMIRRED